MAASKTNTVESDSTELATIRIGGDASRLEQERDLSLFNQVSLSSDVIPEDYAAALAMLEDAGVTVDDADADSIGDGFARVEKSELVNKECLLLVWQFSNPQSQQFKNPYVVVRGIIRENNKRFFFVDGSTGVCEELHRLSMTRVKQGRAAEGVNAGLRLPRGLSESKYPTQDQDGNDIIATTYHLAI